MAIRRRGSRDNRLDGEDHDDQLRDEEEECGGVIGSIVGFLWNHEAAAARTHL